MSISICINQYGLTCAGLKAAVWICEFPRARQLSLPLHTYASVGIITGFTPDGEIPGFSMEMDIS